MPASTGVSKDQLLRAFLTQSAHSSAGAASRATTAGPGGSSRCRPATAGTFARTTAEFLTLSVAEMDGGSLAAPAPPSWTAWRAATADESRARMAQARRDRLGESERLAGLGRASGDLRAYSRGRFQEKLVGSALTRPESERQPTANPSGTSSKSSMSPYMTLPSPESLAIDPEAHYAELACCARCKAGDAAAGEWSAGRQRAQLMSQLRLRQPRQTVRFQHDRTAQELCQEGALPSREQLQCEPPFPWQPSYQYSPFPEPRLSAWTHAEQSRRLERLRLADEFEAEEIAAVASPPPVLLIELTSAEERAGQEPEEEQLPPAETPSGGGLTAPVVQGSVRASGEKQRPRSGRSGRSGGGGKREQQQQTLQQQQLQQQLDQLAAARWRRRNFSVSTIGEEELERSREDQQRLADICQRLRDRQAAREAEAAALKAAEEAARLALEPAPPPPPPTPPPLETQQKQPAKSKSKKSPSRPASGGAKSKRSGSASSGSSGGQKGKKQPQPQPQQRPKQLTEKPSPRAKSPKAGAAAKKKKAAPAAAKKKGPPSRPKKAVPQTPPTPPPPPPPAQPSEPLPPDQFDLLAEEIESASVFHRTKPSGELPDLPCPSSEAKSRQQLTKLWWQQQEFCPPSVIA